MFVREELLVNKLWGKNWSNQSTQVGQTKLVGPVVKKPVVGASTRELRKWWVPAGYSPHIWVLPPVNLVASSPNHPPHQSSPPSSSPTQPPSFHHHHPITFILSSKPTDITRHHHHNRNCHNGRPEKLFPRRTFA